MFAVSDAYCFMYGSHIFFFAFIELVLETLVQRYLVVFMKPYVHFNVSPSVKELQFTYK